MNNMARPLVLFALSLLVIIGEVHSEIPSFLSPCSRSAADFKQCMVAHGNEALPELLKGDKRFKIPNLLPIRFPMVQAAAGSNLRIELLNVDVHGLDTTSVTDMDVDFNANEISLGLHVTRVSLIGNYDIDGKISVLPIKGKGPMNITIGNSDFTYRFTYKLETRSGHDYAIVQENDHLDFHIPEAHFDLENLFDGNKQLGDNVNKFLNENVEEVMKELGDTISATIRALARRIVGNMLDAIPFDELFLL